MRFALVNDMRVEASPSLRGTCPHCSGGTIARCGTMRVWHWAHRGARDCDSWWERETPWHRGWKERFPAHWQEVVRFDGTGEKHVADIRTEHGLVLEFQHSHLAAAEIAAREVFHGNLVWIVDGGRLKRDRPRFLRGLRDLRPAAFRGVFLSRFPRECFPPAWLGCRRPVVFDFEGGPWDARREKLWCLLPGRADGHAVVARMSPRSFIQAAHERARMFPDRLVDMISARLRDERAAEMARVRRAFHPPPRRWKGGFRQYRRRKF